MVIASFAMMGLSDILKMRGRDPAGKVLFAAGALVLAAAGLLSFFTGARFYVAPALRIACFTLAALGIWGEYISLFGALPAKATYLKGASPTCLVSSGVYALCRHPGALFFPLMSISLALGLGSRSLLFDSLLASLLNVFYVWFQDRVVFPRTIPGYDSYRQMVPFLLPTARSLARAAARTNDKQDDV